MPGHEFVELCDLVVGDAAKNVGEPGLRIDAAELCRQVCKTWFQGGVSGPLLFLVRVCCGSRLCKNADAEAFRATIETGM